MSNVIKFENFFDEIEKSAREVYESLNEEDLNEVSENGSVDNPNSPAHKALKKKAEKSGFPLDILKQVFKRGKAAWKRGHVPGVTPNQWAFARTNSFITGGKTTKMSDKALYDQAKKNKKQKR